MDTTHTETVLSAELKKNFVVAMLVLVCVGVGGGGGGIEVAAAGAVEDSGERRAKPS